MSHAYPISNKQLPTPGLNPQASDMPHLNSQHFYSGAMLKDQVPRLAFGRVHSLPSLTYLQKVDTWKANQLGSDSVSPKKKAHDVVSDTLNYMLSWDTCLTFGANSSSQMTRPLSSSHSGSGSPCQVDVCRGQASESPVNSSHSHSSLSSVVTSIQRDTGTHSQQVPVAQSDEIIPATRSLDHQLSLVSGGRDRGSHSSAPHMNKSSVKMSPLLSLGHFSDASSNLNMSSTLSSSQGSFQGGSCLFCSESLG